MTEAPSAPSSHPSPAQSLQEGEGHHALLFFDGVCNLCNGFVNFVIDNDPEGYFILGALQSDAARPHLRACGIDPEALDTLVLIENGEIYERSTAALRVARHLRAPWPLLYALIAIPAPLRDRVYDWVADHRYQWFGRRNQCRVPTPDLQSRFLQQAA